MAYSRTLNRPIVLFDDGVLSTPDRPGAATAATSGRGASPRTRLLITIDTEIAPHTSDWRRERGRFALGRDVYGATPLGERGLRYQLELFANSGLTCVVFVEALCAGVLGSDLLEEIVGLVLDRGHRVGLHLHTEWLAYYERSPLGNRLGRFMHDFAEDEQRVLIECGLENLARAGARDVVAIRAGNAAANGATLRAARRSGLFADSSYFAPEVSRNCHLDARETPQPAYIEGILEVPISWFRDGVGRVRPAQLCACSSVELEHLLIESWRRGAPAVTLLLHSFELVRRHPAPRHQTVVRLHHQRLLRLCRFLGEHRDEFVPTTFRDLVGIDVECLPPVGAVRSPFWHAMQRYAEQAVGRVW